MNTFTEEHKKQIEKMIVDASIDALEVNAIKEEELGDIAEFVLARIDAIQTTNDLEVFLKELVGKWKFFHPIEQFMEAQQKHEEEKVYVTKAEEYAKHGNVEEALAAIRQADN